MPTAASWTSRLQLALNVDDLATSIAFYSRLLGTEPAKVRPGYANFAVADPPLKLVLIENPGQGGSLNHLGVEVEDVGAVDAVQARLSADGLASVDERDTTCCYARQDKFWVQDTPDGERWEVPDRDVLPFSKRHAVLTTPPYPIADSQVSAHLRWYLANSLHREALAAGGDPEKTVFLSIHADSLHPSVRGATVYIPGAAMIGGEFGKSGAVYASRREVREKPRVRYSTTERVKSEGLSRQLAEQVLAEFRARGLAIHPSKPVREKIIRARSAYVPAVLRYNAVPAKALLEVCNLANAEDRRLRQTRAFRQRVAEAVVEGILAYYGADGRGAPQTVTAAAK